MKMFKNMKTGKKDIDGNDIKNGDKVSILISRKEHLETVTEVIDEWGLSHEVQPCIVKIEARSKELIGLVEYNIERCAFVVRFKGSLYLEVIGGDNIEYTEYLHMVCRMGDVKII